MIRWAKNKLYFVVAQYFACFAKIQLRRWKPRVIVVTGSSGKTTLLGLIESQLTDKAHYSHKANSTYGVAFDILGLKRTTLLPSEWFALFLQAPFGAFRKPRSQRIYVVEVDCERPGEGKFLAKLLTPEVTLWLNSGTTHSTNFDRLVAARAFQTVQAAIAHEFAYLARATTQRVFASADIPEMTEELKTGVPAVTLISSEQLKKYAVSDKGTDFEIAGSRYHIPALLPQEAAYAVSMTQQLVEYLGESLDNLFTHFVLPPGRSSILKGIKDTVLIDSSYNATPDGTTAMLQLFTSYPAANKWLVIGDMIELGISEAQAHKQLAQDIASVGATHIVLVGSRVSKYTQPVLRGLLTETPIVAFEMPAAALSYILKNIEGGETILFKGARFLEGVIEHVLANKADVAKLCRREKVWHKRRKQWGL